VRHVDAGSCNGCESELQALNNPFYNLHWLGIFFTASPPLRRFVAGDWADGARGGRC
jgi:Ni,Fe-hydrogenase III small subunit